MSYRMAYFEGDMEVGYYCVECKATTDNLFPEQHEPDCKYHDKHCKACPDWHKEVRQHIKEARKQAFLEAVEITEAIEIACLDSSYSIAEHSMWQIAKRKIAKLLREKAEE